MSRTTAEVIAARNAAPQPYTSASGPIGRQSERTEDDMRQPEFRCLIKPAAAEVGRSAHQLLERIRHAWTFPLSLLSTSAECARRLVPLAIGFTLSASTTLAVLGAEWVPAAPENEGSQLPSEQPPDYSSSSAAEAFVCRSNESVRRLEARYPNPGAELPCEVVDTKTDQPQVLWRAEVERGFCRGKVQEIAAALKDSGWVCEQMVAAAREAAMPARREATRVPDDAQQVDIQSSDDPEAERRPTPDERSYNQPIEHRLKEAALQVVVARDLGRLNQRMSSGIFEVEAVQQGDLDKDGSEDAAVLLSHILDGVRTAHYLLAYLYRAEFQLVTGRYVGGAQEGIFSAELEQVADGTIRLQLRVPEPGDPQCCPTGRRPSAFALEREVLVEVPTS